MADENDLGSVVNSPAADPRDGGMSIVSQEERESAALRSRLSAAVGCRVVAVRRIADSSLAGQARLGTFHLHCKAVAENRGGSANVRSAWYGASADEVRRLGGGFSVKAGGGGAFGFGLQLSPERCASESVLSSTPDGDGIRHVVFCRVIMGSVERVLPNSKQFCPSSENFDSGVDNLQSPTKYIVWYPDVNTRILPLYVLSIKMDIHEKGLKESVTRPTSPWISFQALISVLSSHLPPPAMTVIRKLHGDFVERKMTRKQLIQRVRELTGDKLLISAIKSFQTNKVRVGSKPHSRNNGSK